jgi:hypothetical protein
MQAPARPTRLSILPWVAFVALSLFIFLPTMSAPLEADDRYWYLNVSGAAFDSHWDIFTESVAEIPETLRDGRVAPLAFAARRSLGRLTTQVAIAATIPIAVVHGVAKLALLLASILIVFGFMRALRWRSGDGSAEPLRPDTIRRVMVFFVALLVVGSQTHAPFRNGWVSFPVLTYGAVIVVFGTMAATLWAARQLTHVTGGKLLLVASGVALLGAGLNLTYELYYIVVPLVPLSLFLIPLADNRQAERRARKLVSVIYLASFAVVFAWLRVLITRSCSAGTCYAGVEPALSTDTLTTAFRNMASAIPGVAGAEQVSAQALDMGMNSAWAMPLSASLSLAGPLLAIAMVWLMSRRDAFESGTNETNEADNYETRTLIRAGMISLLVAVGAAGIMALSAQAQDVVTSTGFPHRNAVVSWASLALLISLLMGGLSLRTGKLMPTLLAAGLVAWLGAVTLPVNAAAVHLYRIDPRVQVIERIHWEVVLGDPSTRGDTRRCTLYAQAEDSIFTAWVDTSMKRGARDTFQHYHGRPFCSTWPDEI